MSDRVKFILLTSLIVFLLSPLCPKASNSAEAMSSNNVIIVKKDLSGQTIVVPRGDIIQIELPFLGSAGYKWHIDNVDSEYLEFISEQTEEISKETIVGAPVLDVLLFKARKAGETDIKINQYRPWEGIKKATDHFILKIIIK